MDEVDRCTGRLQTKPVVQLVGLRVERDHEATAPTHLCFHCSCWSMRLVTCFGEWLSLPELMFVALVACHLYMVTNSELLRSNPCIEMQQGGD